MKKCFHISVDDTDVRGVIVGKTKNTISLRLVEPKNYSCTATCNVGEHSDERMEDLLKALFLMLTCIEALLRNDKSKRIHLKVLLHHADSRVLKMEECLSTVRRLLDDAATSTNDIKKLYAVIIGEYRYWQSVRVKKFNDCFKESIGRWVFRDLPIIVDPQ